MMTICNGFSILQKNFHFHAIRNTHLNIKRHFVRVSYHSDQIVIGTDQTHVKVNALVKYSIEDAKQSRLNLEDLNKAFEDVAKSTLEERLSKFSSHEIVHHRKGLGSEIFKGLQKAAAFLGIKLESLDIKDASIDSSKTKESSEKSLGQRILEEKLKRYN